MSTVQEIERAIARLSTRELEELYGWMDQHCPQPIDSQLQSDLEAGLIDARIQRALDNHKVGETRLL